MLHIRLVLAALFSLLALQALGKKDKPDIEDHTFENQPLNVLYFEDSDVIITTIEHTGTAWRSANGGFKWEKLDDVEEGEVYEMLKHPYDKKTAVILGSKKTHWITHDRGESWKEFTAKESPSMTRPGIAFHASDPKRMLFHAETCKGIFFCDSSVYYTTDGFESKPERLDEDVVSCLWAKSSDIFTTGDEDLDMDRVLCIAKGKFSGLSSNNRIVYSDDFFKSHTTEVTVSDGRTVEGITNIAGVKKYIVFAAKGDKTTEMAMYVTDDTKAWHRAEFGEHKLEENAYTLLESTNYSMQVDIMTTSATSAMGVLLTSNSNGTFFTKNIEHTNRNMRGFVDFEKVSNIQGIVLVNTVDNWEEVERKWMADKKVKSSISFDDGRTWEPLKADKKDLHLHSVTKQRNVGRIFSSPAPGLVMGVGNTGDYLKGYDEGDLYVSDDAGLTWKLALERPHIYEFGAQGSILVAVEDGETDLIRWSLNHGKDWDKLKLDDKIKPIALTTTPDSTSLKFLLVATEGGGGKTKHKTFALNFEGLHERECKKGDFEKWPARVDEDGEATCIMGHKQFFQRRKADADCLAVSEDFEDPEEDRETCQCTKKDFECDYNFKLEDGKCVKSGPVIPPEGACKGSDKTYRGTSGYRLIPGNDCKGGEDFAEEIERECSDTKVDPVSGEISKEITKFPGDKFVEYYYLERTHTNTGDDETIIMRTDRREVWKTHDHGKHWSQPEELKDEEILAIYPHQYINERVYMITPGSKVFYSKDTAKKFHHFDTKSDPNQKGVQVLSFHPSEPDWLLWTGGKDCESGGKGCQTVAEISQKNGEDWMSLLSAVRKCQFVYVEEQGRSDQLVYCEQFENEDDEGSLTLLSSEDWFAHKKELKRDVINFATMEEYIVVAVRDEDQETLKVDTSIDGEKFADAQFPANFHVPHQQAYTVLDSSTHAVFLHVTVNNVQDQEYGSIVKSNSNGTSYVLSQAQVNRNPAGYVDFEKMQGLEGVAIINVVSNAKETDSGSAKKLQTKITHNDGADWALLQSVEAAKDTNFKYECNPQAGKNDCALHLHGYTERKDPRDTFSSPSAVGIMIATGNVGYYLGHKQDANTFITRNGGVTWLFAAEGNWMWEYGDQGSIIVIVKEDEPTDFVRYTLDEGRNWKEYKFGETMNVDDITTVPSDTSRNFLLWGKIGGKIATINIDFSGLEERSKQCKLDEDNPDAEDSDYYFWTPKHPLSDDDCLFGHVAQYHRKKWENDCYNGRAIQHLHSIARNCTCTRADFECDWNYERRSDQSCHLIDGLEKANPKDVCEANPGLTEYYEITGYRRIPLTTCQGGKELDLTSRTHPCPGKEEQYERKHGIGGIGLFFAIVLPIAAAAGVGYWVWKNWDGKFGRIRLGDGMGGGYGGAFDSDAPWVKYPVMVLSGLIAVVAAVPMVIGSIWRMVSSRLGRSGGYQRPYTTRSSFQRGRGDYAAVDADEGELLGDDSDEDV